MFTKSADVNSTCRLFHVKMEDKTEEAEFSVTPEEPYK